MILMLVIIYGYIGYIIIKGWYAYKDIYILDYTQLLFHALEMRSRLSSSFIREKFESKTCSICSSESVCL